MRLQELVVPMQHDQDLGIAPYSNGRSPSATAALQSVALPYRSSREHLLAELEFIDLLLRVQALRARAARARAGESTDALLTGRIGQPVWENAPVPSELAERQAALDALTTRLALRCAATEAAGVTLRLSWVQTCFGLSALEVRLLLLSLAAEVDTQYEPLFALLSDGEECRRLTVGLALLLLCPTPTQRFAARSCFAAQAPLRRFGLLGLRSESQAGTSTLLASTLCIDPSVLGFLIEEDCAPALPWLSITRAAASLDTLILEPAFRAQLVALSRHLDHDELPPVFVIEGRSGSGRRTLVAACSQARARTLVIIDGPALLAAGVSAAEATAWAAVREARLGHADLLWEGFDRLLQEASPPLRAQVLQALAAAPGALWFSVESPLLPTDLPLGRAFIPVRLAPPAQQEVVALWRRALAAVPTAADIDLAALVARFRFGPAQIRDALATARGLARWRDPSAGQVTQNDLMDACRRHAAPLVLELARRVDHNVEWDDLILPPERLEQLHELCDQARTRQKILDDWGLRRHLPSGKGLTVLLSGPPGTGKTLAASAIARALGCELYQIDLSAIVSKYIGETEKHLARVFNQTEGSSAVLFFDEADSLFGKRSEVRDSHDRYANLETSYLLQRIEAYEGVVILATNFARNLDEAFVRRLHAVIELPLPEARERQRIWERLWPAGVPAEELDLAYLARRFELSGGYIRNIVLASAALAAAAGTAVTMTQVLRAVRREYQKMGRILDESAFQYSKPPSAQAPAEVAAGKSPT